MEIIKKKPLKLFTVTVISKEKKNIYYNYVSTYRKKSLAYKFLLKENEWPVNKREGKGKSERKT